MAQGKKRLRTFIVWLLATAGVIVAGCFAVNCLVDPLWYLRGNVLTAINYPFNERMAKIIRFLPRMADYDCVIFGTSRASLLPENEIPGYRCYNLAVSDGQVGEWLLYADYLRQRGFAPKLMLVEMKRGDLVGPAQEIEVPDFIRSGSAPPSILITYLSLDALDFSIRTLQGDAPHHRYYDADFGAQLEKRSKRHYYNPTGPIKPMPPPTDVHPERAEQYVALRQKFPTARAIAFVPPESAWRMASFGLTDGFDAYLGAVARVAAAYDAFLDFSVPSAMTQSKNPADTYDGVHYSRAVNGRVLAALIANKTDAALDWHAEDAAAASARYRGLLADFMTTTAQAEASPGRKEKPAPDTN
jgi:hypothetical protein